jgi:hypothetical protein
MQWGAQRKNGQDVRYHRGFLSSWPGREHLLLPRDLELLEVRSIFGRGEASIPSRYLWKGYGIHTHTFLESAKGYDGPSGTFNVYARGGQYYAFGKCGCSTRRFVCWFDRWRRQWMGEADKDEDEDYGGGTQSSTEGADFSTA